MRYLRGVIGAAVGLAAVCGVGRAGAACQIKQFAELPVTVANNRFLVDVVIRGKAVKMFVDSGAVGTALFANGAEQLGIAPNTYVRPNVEGVGGVDGAVAVNVGDIQLGGYTVRNASMMVLTRGVGGDEAGIIGRDILDAYDLEFDIAHHAIRLLQAQGCTDAEMPYWGTSYLQAPLDPARGYNPDFSTSLNLNGRPTRAIIDSGSPVTIVTTAAANNAGVYASAFRASGETRGVGGGGIHNYVATFETVDVGGETVHGVALDVSDMFARNRVSETGSRLTSPNSTLPRALIGADFLIANRVLLSLGHRMMYFTYQGGRVFETPVRPGTPQARP